MKIEYATYIKHNKEWDEHIIRMIECPIDAHKEVSKLFPSSPTSNATMQVPSTDR